MPELYDDYVDYNKLHHLIKHHKEEVKQQKKEKLSGIWFMGGDCKVVQVPVTSHLPKDMDPASFNKALTITQSIGPFTNENMSIDKIDPSPAIKDELHEGAG